MELSFILEEAIISYTTIWVRIPQLPTEFYDISIPKKVGRKLGKLLRIDMFMSSTLRGRYARICIHIPLYILVRTSVVTGKHNQTIMYVGEGVLCKGCGRIMHVFNNYTYTTTKPVGEVASTSLQHHNGFDLGEWKTVPFTRRQKNSHILKIRKLLQKLLFLMLNTQLR